MTEKPQEAGSSSLDSRGDKVEDRSREEADDHPHRPSQAGLSLQESARRLSGADDAVYFGSERQKFFASALASEIERLKCETAAPSAPTDVPKFFGGEHLVFESGDQHTVIKHTLAGVFGRTLDEMTLLDARTFQNRRRLAMRGASPSEYLRRWAVLQDIFKLPTEYLGKVEDAGRELQMAVSQPYIEQDDHDPPLRADIIAFMEAHGFLQVEAEKIANPEIRDVTWYRQRDGILITDAHPRNFRKDLQGRIVPIDLVVMTIPKGVSKLLPEPEREWQFT